MPTHTNVCAKLSLVSSLSGTVFPADSPRLADDVDLPFKNLLRQEDVLRPRQGHIGLLGDQPEEAVVPGSTDRVCQSFSNNNF